MRHSARGHWAVLTHQELQIHSLQQFHHKVERLVVSDPEVVQLHGVRRAQVGRRFRLASEARHRTLCSGGVACSQHLWADQLDRRGPREHAMGGLVDLPHPAAPQSLTELVAAHLSRPGHLLAQRRDHVRDHDRHADQEEIGIVHQQRVGRRVEVPGPASSRDQHAQGVHRHRDEAGSQRLCRRAWDDGGKHQDHGADPRNLRRDDTDVHGLPVKHHPEGYRCEHHVSKAEIEDAPRIPVAPARVEVEQHGCHHADRGDEVGNAEAKPLRIAVAHGANGEMPEHRREHPETARHQ